jgi:methylase of polypeptide subunit release factors
LAGLFPGLARWTSASFIDSLKNAGYTHHGVADVPSFIRQPYLETLQAVARESLSTSRDKRATALKMFALGDSVQMEDALELLGWLVKDLIELGLIEQNGNTIRSRFHVTPADDHDYYVSDFPMRQADPEGDVVLGVSPAARQLFKLAPPVKEGMRVLEAGCGIAWLSRKMAALGAEVTATDINPRAIQLAQLNAVLSGIDSVHYREGDFFDAAKGTGPFDLIMCNPPYVVAPDTGLIYRDGSEEESVCRSVIKRVPDYLAPGGIAVIMMNWGHAQDHDWRDIPLSWCSDADIQYWLNQSDCASATDYAWRWISLDPRHEGRDPAAAEMRRWQEFYTRKGYHRISSGFIVVRRPSESDESGWKRTDSRASRSKNRLAGEDILRVMLNESWLRSTTCSPTDLLTRNYKVAPGLNTLIETRLDQGWIRKDIKLFSPGRLSYEGDIDENVLRLLEIIEQGKPPQAIIDEIKDKHGDAIAKQLDQSLSKLIKQMISFGILIPDERPDVLA